MEIGDDRKATSEPRGHANGEPALWTGSGHLEMAKLVSALPGLPWRGQHKGLQESPQSHKASGIPHLHHKVWQCRDSCGNQLPMEEEDSIQRNPSFWVHLEAGLSSFPVLRPRFSPFAVALLSLLALEQSLQFPPCPCPHLHQLCYACHCQLWETWQFASLDLLLTKKFLLVEARSSRLLLNWDHLCPLLAALCLLGWDEIPGTL